MINMSNKTMNLVLAILVLISCIAGFYSKFSQIENVENNVNVINGIVIKVADGDTITVLTSDKKELKVRLKNIDAPEKKQEYGTQARKFTTSLVFGRNVELKISGKDKYNREIAEVFINGLNINKEIVKQGYAWAYREHLDDKSYIELEQYARKNRLGLWNSPNPIKPSEWRKGDKL